MWRSHAVSNRLTSITDSSATYAMTYDAEGRLSTVSNTNTPNVPQTTLTYTYNTRDDRTALADNRSGSVAYTYDNAHRLTETRMTVTGQSVSPKVVLGYDNANRLTSLSRTNANAYSGGATVATALTFDAASRPTAISHTAGGNTLGSYALTWDNANQLTQETSNHATVNFAYDSAGQLTGATGGRSETYTYDAVGNRTMTGYSTGTGNRLASDGTFNYSYDNDGNLLTKTEISTGKVSEYVWDYRNRLTNVRQKNSSGGAVVQEQIYRYDPMDRRIGVGSDPDGAGSQPATWQWTVYDGQNPYVDFDNSGSLTNRFLSGDAVDQLFGRMSSSGTTAWYLTDQLGSVRDIANTSGTLIDEVSYDSFGKVLSESSPTNGDRFKYTGRELDPTTGQYYYRARYYDAAVGRFTSQDPIGFASGDTNTYRYVGNSPTLMVDPTGLADQPPITTIFKLPEPSPVPSGPGGVGNGVPGGKTGPPLSTYTPPPAPRLPCPNALPPVAPPTRPPDGAYLFSIPRHNGGPDLDIYSDRGTPVPHRTPVSHYDVSEEERARIKLLIFFHFVPVIAGEAKVGGVLTDKAIEMAEKHGMPYFLENLKYIYEYLENYRKLKIPAMPPPMEPVKWPFPGAYPGTPCFVAGTHVHTADGLRGIETISTGTEVWAYDQERLGWVLSRVLDTEAHDYVGAMVTIKVGNDTIEATTTHPFWVVSGETLETRPTPMVREDANRASSENGRWVAAGDLQRGDALLARDGHLLTVMSTQSREASARVYNLRVDLLQNYAVGDAGLLVNNM